MMVPETPQEFNDAHPFYMSDLPPKKSGLTTRLGTEIAYPEQMQTQFHLSKSEDQLKQLGLGLMQLSQDYEKLYRLIRLSWKETFFRM